jgi:L-Ala-D/L-Glu epimerase
MKHRIKGVIVTRVRWPLIRPFVTALGQKSHTDNVLVRVRLEDGGEGWGEASSSLAMPWQTGSLMAAALRRLGALFRGRDIREVEEMLPAVWSAEVDMPTAAAAFETALWDARARAEGVPFFRLWGDAGRELETLMSVSAVSPGDVSVRVREARRKGFRCFKLKLNGREPERMNLDRLRAARRSAPRASLLLDPNQSYRPEDLLSLLDAARHDGVPVSLVEEPFKKQDWKTLLSFRGKSTVPLILDETVQSPADALRAVRGTLSRGVNVKLAKSGPSRGKAIADLFRAKKGVLMIGCMAESRIGLAAAAQFAMGLGGFDFVDLDSDLLLKPTRVSGGYVRRGPWLTLPKKPFTGLGVSL